MSSTRIAVAGATGRVGRHVVDVVRERGHEAVPMSRATGVDVLTGRGLAEALRGADVIVDATSSPSPDEQEGRAFFTTAAAHLHAAGAEAGATRMVVVSIIGVDRFAGGYNAAKVAHEQAALAGPLEARIVRAAQFHEFVEVLMTWGMRDGAIHVPAMRTQLVAARAVAEVLVDAALHEAPAAGIAEVAGPREERLVEAAALVAQRRGLPVPVEAAWHPGDPDEALYASGALLPGPGATLAGPAFADWLQTAYAAAA